MSSLSVSRQHSVLDGLEPGGSEDRELVGGRAEPPGGGVRRRRLAERPHLRLFYGPGVLGGRRYARRV